MSKRDFVFAAFDNKPVERVPVGFWFHFAPEAFYSPTKSHIQKNIVGHQAYFEDFQPDFLKLMSDGYAPLFSWCSGALKKRSPRISSA